MMRAKRSAAAGGVVEIMNKTRTYPPPGVKQFSLPGSQRCSFRVGGQGGAHIDGLRALVLGLVPDCRLQAVTSVGHAAGHGAWIVLVNAAARVDIQGVVRRIEMSHRHHPEAQGASICGLQC